MTLNRGKIKIIQPFFHFWTNSIQDISLFNKLSFDKSCNIISKELFRDIRFLIFCGLARFFCWWRFDYLENFLLFCFNLDWFFDFCLDLWQLLDLGLHLNCQAFCLFKMHTLTFRSLSIFRLVLCERWWRWRWW